MQVKSSLLNPYTPSYREGSKLAAEDDFAQRIKYLFNRFLQIKIPMGRNRNPITVKQLMDDSQARLSLILRIKKKALKRFQHFSQEVDFQYQKMMNLPPIKTSVEFQQRHLTLKILTYALKIITAISKIHIIPGSKGFKDIASLIKLWKKIFNFKDLPDAFNRFSEIWQHPDYAIQGLKTVYHCLDLVDGVVTALNNNECTRLAYEIVGWGGDYTPIHVGVVSFCNTIALPLHIIKICSVSYNTFEALKQWRHVEKDESTEKRRIKNLKLGKASLKMTGLTLKIASGILTVGIIGTPASTVLGGVVIGLTVLPPVCSALSAGIGWILTYKVAQPSNAQKTDIEPAQAEAPICAAGTG